MTSKLVVTAKICADQAASVDSRCPMMCGNSESAEAAVLEQ